jgi:poly(3-hydroxybutyrate) depolymerase
LTEAAKNMENLKKHSDRIRSRIESGKRNPLYQRYAVDLELRVWAIAETIKTLGQPDAPENLGARTEAALEEAEGLLDSFDQGQDALAQRRGMVVRGFRAPGQDHPQPYGIHVPQAYDPGKAWPLFIYLHGGRGGIPQDRFAMDRLAPAAPPAPAAAAGFRAPASQPATQPALALPSMIEQMLKIWLPRRGGNWAEPINEQSVFAAIADVKANYNVDADRVYVQGFSLGGFATVHYAIRFPDAFAGAGPSGMTKDYDVLPFAENLAHVPMFLCHGTLDDTCDVNTTRHLFGRLRDWRYDAVFQEEVRVRHQTTELARAAQEAWLLTKRRNPWPDKVVYVTDNPRYHRAYWVDIVEIEALAEKELARVEAIRNGPGDFAMHTQHVVSLAIVLDEAIAPRGKPVTVSINDHGPVTYPWPEDGRLVLRVPAASSQQ